MQDVIKEIIDEEILDIQCCSRLLHKNIVYHVSTINNEYAVKFFNGGTDKEERFKKEILMYNFFQDKKVINTSEIIDIRNSIYGNVITIKWIRGKSIKSKLKNDSLNNCYSDIQNMLNDMEKIWKIKDGEFRNKLPIDKLGIENRFNKSEKSILTQIIRNKPKIDFFEIINIYTELKKLIKPNLNFVINSDISTHEYLITNQKAYWLDFETYKLGNPNNDLARAFQSLTNSIYNRKDEFERIYDLFKNNRYYNAQIFLYYLTEKLFSTIYTANNQINEDEINFYINFIKENFYNINNNIKIKKRNYFK